jgi:hypothetical protein
MVNKMFGNKKQISFDDFFALEKEVLQSHIKKNPTIEIDSTQI